MNVVILHLSDIHISKAQHPVISRIKEIANTLEICNKEAFACFIVISGDITDKGLPEEYKIALDFISDLKKEIESRNNVDQVNLILVPGNHDCNFKDAKETRTDLIYSVQHKEDATHFITNDHINEITQVQKEYFKFMSELNINSSSNPLYWLYQYEIDTYQLNFLCFNSAWMSQKDEIQGTLIFPSQLIDLNSGQSENNTINISVFHHPFSWFDSKYVREFKSLINSNSNVIITGHEHDNDNRTQISVRGKIQEILEGGLLQHKKEKESSFNLEIINLDTLQQKKCLLLWDNSKHFYNVEEEIPFMPFEAFQSKNVFTLNKEFETFLNRLNVQIMNPKSQKLLEASDIYIPPSMDVELAKQGIISKRKQVVKGIQPLIKIIREYKKVLILGGKYYGKTLLLKKLFSMFYDEDIVPIFCGYNDFAQMGRAPEATIKRLFINQYENQNDVEFQKFRQYPREKKVIIIDDLSKTGLEIQKIEFVLDKVQQYFDLVVIASNPIISLNEILTGPRLLIDYTRIQLNEFMSSQVSALMQRWTWLIHPEFSEVEKRNKLRTLENTLFNTIGRDISIRNPFFLLTILVKLETDSAPESQSRAYGYYFQTIINVMMAKIAKKPSSIPFINHYFTSLAYYMLIKGTGKIDRSDFLEFNEQYIEKTGYSLNIDDILTNSLTEEVLLYEEDIYSFSHNYYFEYFAAQYISENIRNTKMQNEIAEIIEKISLHIHKEVYAGIMMFLCFHSKDPIILENITDKVRSIFFGLDKFDSHRDTEFLNRRSPNTKIRFVTDRPLEETKNEILEAQDFASSELGEIQYGLIQDVNNIDELTVINKLAYALSLIKVFGQVIIRFMPEDVDSRVGLIKELYDLGLQNIKYFLGEIESDIDEVQEGLALYIKDRNPSISYEKLNDATNDWIFALSESLCLINIKSISQNIGAEELQKTYKLVLNKYPSQAFEFIDISIELDHFEEIPERKIINLARTLDDSNNYFCKDLLCLLFIHHIYQNYTKQPQRQRIASALGLEHLMTEPNIFLSGKKLLPRKTRDKNN